jgi:hypothetical protein
MTILKTLMFLIQNFSYRVSKMLGQTAGENFPHQNKGKASYKNISATII